MTIVLKLIISLGKSLVYHGTLSFRFCIDFQSGHFVHILTSDLELIIQLRFAKK